MFFAVSGILIFLCNIAGVYLTADCLSEEKRNGTLGLLFLTNLRGYEVVLGKMSVGSIQAVLGLLAAVPMLVVPVLMGGVDPMLVLRMTIVLFATLFLSLSVGMACSANFKSSKVTAGVALGIMFFLNFGPILIYQILHEIQLWDVRDPNILSTGSIYVLTVDGGLGLGGRADVAFNNSMAVVIAFAFLSVLFAIWKTARAWQDQPVKSVMDLISSFFLASALGRGVLFSALGVLLFQGALTLGFYFVGISGFLFNGELIMSPELIVDLTATGGVLLLALGLDLIGLKKFKMLDLVPALAILPIIHFLHAQVI